MCIPIVISNIAIYALVYTTAACMYLEMIHDQECSVQYECHCTMHIEGDSAMLYDHA